MHICFWAVDKVDMLISIVLLDFWNGFDDFLIDDISLLLFKKFWSKVIQYLLTDKKKLNKDLLKE